MWENRCGTQASLCRNWQGGGMRREEDYVQFRGWMSMVSASFFGDGHPAGKPTSFAIDVSENTSEMGGENGYRNIE